ncbi:MAG: DNA repair protein RadC, partial [Acinetobacter junii]
RKIMYRKACSSKKAFTDPTIVKQYLTISNQITEPMREVFRVLFLDNQHQLLADETMFMGTIDASPVYPRVVVQKALEHNAAALILSHNHPSGIVEPSHADKAITNRLKQALELVDIRVLDHIIVGDTETVSFAERGLL